MTLENNSCQYVLNIHIDNKVARKRRTSEKLNVSQRSYNV